MSSDAALLGLLELLKSRSYQFVTTTPATHAQVILRRTAGLRDILGWSRDFNANSDPDVVALLGEAGMLEHLQGGSLRSKVRVSSLDDLLFLHSAYPTDQNDSVFFGPDSYRFASFLKSEAPRLQPHRHAVDIGTGAGVGGIVLSRLLPGAKVTLTDINEQAIRFARINAEFNGAEVELIQTNALDGVVGDIDCIIANPPYIADRAHRAYRDGGGMRGGALSLAWARDAAQRLKSGGAFLLYTGSAILDGEDKLKAALFDALDGFDITYREIDPDVFGEELERDDYADVDRIAVVGLVAIKR